MKKKFPILAVNIAVFTIYSCAPRVYHNPPPTTQPSPPPVEKEAPAPVPTKAEPEKPAPEILNTLSANEKANGWQLLFDGISTDGWHAYGSRSIGTAWKVANGTLYADHINDGIPKTGGDIVSDKEYKNFELQIDWKISKNGNSGICFNVQEDKNKYEYMWLTGPEIQIVDNDGHPDGKIPKHQAGDLYDLLAATQHAERAPTQWNHYLIRSVNGKLDVYLNDVHIISTEMWNGNWRNMIAGSKFKSMPDFGSFKMGRIGLQDHGDDVFFRNIKIKEL